ncbi:4-hydroxythreonine-4-phosphate dehydrogenase PdxA [Flavobacteriaceae bacterium]|jgi:4-phospho-D-threonate 3-dehydrogenase / 4-phospho-D-erythronate 3-dehydrogenase|nr:4-hydroxythreonine-4-phosphate dehydrogenase PdxA [Flavobacteriaceae bacterium]
MENNKKLKVGISIGDMNGIGPEIILKTFNDTRIFEFCTPIIYCSLKNLNFFKSHFSFEIKTNVIKSPEQATSNCLNIIEPWNFLQDINFGKCDLKIGELAVKSLEAAAIDIKNKNIDVLVTAPINKEAIQSESFTFKGHTDYLDSKFEGSSLMFMITNNLKIGLLTEHVPVSAIKALINEDLIVKKIDGIYQSLQKDFSITRPKIAVLGINPHSGDNGVIGNEDDTILKPALEKAKAKGKLIYGPYAADSFFGSDNYKNFDAVIAAYHDQGLIPFKTLSFGCGVNYTSGLEIVRTSPDHGTAFEIAGKGVADQTSFKKALFYAIEIFNTRVQENELSSNPLKVFRLPKNKKNSKFNS